MIIAIIIIITINIMFSLLISNISNTKHSVIWYGYTYIFTRISISTTTG